MHSRCRGGFRDVSLFSKERGRMDTDHRYCNCKDFHALVIKKIQQQWFFSGDYDRDVWFDSDDADSKAHHLRTNHFKENMDQVHIMCPKHHPFFIYLAGIVHLRPSEVQAEFRHAWYNEASGCLKVLVFSIHSRLFRRIAQGLHKAWKGFSGHPKSNVEYFYEELGHFYGEQSDDYEDSTVDGWYTISGLGAALWSGAFT
jgi:hypothetical protein